MKYIVALLLLIFLLLSIGCNVQKKVEKYNAAVDKGVADYINKNPCVNDTVTLTKSDTVTNTETKTDTVYEHSKDTVTVRLKTTNTITKRIRDTVTNTVTDNQKINFLQTQLNAATNENKAITANLAKETIESADWKQSARNRLYLLIAVVTGFGIWTFRKPLLKLITFV